MEIYLNYSEHYFLMVEINLTDYQSDIFREIGNVGIGHGATALSQMISRDVIITIPDIQIVDLNEIFSQGGDYMISNCKLQGDLGGGILGVFDKKNALHLVDLMFSQPIGSMTEVNEDVKSAFNEMVNIVGGCYLNALADLLKLKLLPLPPVFLYGNLVSIHDSFLKQFKDATESFYVKTKFTIGSDQISGAIYLIFTKESSEKVLKLIDNMGLL